ncbi:MAG: HAMP domain-containing histidine kinase [bacterium]|nr:HAMP domain-containing histidine kinase [bacterium]
MSVDQQGVLIVALVILSYALFCPVLAAVNYHRLWSSHRSHAAVLRAQRNLLLTENAALTGRLAAALSHELNSPLGAVKSAVSTLGELPRRYRSASEDQLPALESLEAQLQTASAEAIHRMNDIIHRMQRFTNLDRAEVRQVRIGDLLADIIALIEPESRRQVDLRIEESPTPALVCRPQPLSAVLSSLIQDAIESVPKPGKVCVQTAGISYSVTITIRDNRPPIPLRTLATMFDPSFRVTGGRIAAANWNWFTSRQIIRENGGDLTVTSGKEETITTVTLPAAGGPA